MPERIVDARCGFDEFGTDCGGHAGDGNNGIVLHFALSSWFEHDLRANAFRVCREGKPVPTFPDHAAGNKKAPDLFRRGFGSDDAIVRLRAHASRGPRGLCGFGGAFGGRDHERDLMGESLVGVNGFCIENRSQRG